jgi:hypothetical protein
MAKGRKSEAESEEINEYLEKIKNCIPKIVK